MTEKQNWHWLPQWAPTFAVVVAPFAAVVPASFHLGGELACLGGEIDRLDEGQAELKAGQARLEARLDSLAMRMESLLGELRTEMRADRAALADVRERVSALEGRQLASPEAANAPSRVRPGTKPPLSAVGEAP